MKTSTWPWLALCEDSMGDWKNDFENSVHFVTVATPKAVSCARRRLSFSYSKYTAQIAGYDEIHV
jgi:hypothetical protein